MLKNKHAEETRKTMAAHGALGLPEMLERRRWEYAIPDAAFEVAAVYDRVLVWQVFPGQTETYGETAIYKPQMVVSAEQKTAPVGIIVSAGLQALDILRSNGMDYGHIVHFVQMAFYRLELGYDGATPVKLVVLRAGDIVDSVDTMVALRTGECSMQYRVAKNDDGSATREHYFVGKDGQTWAPMMPFIAEDL